LLPIGAEYDAAGNLRFALTGCIDVSSKICLGDCLSRIIHTKAQQKSPSTLLVVGEK
jgi:hypothetical protein